MSTFQGNFDQCCHEKLKFRHVDALLDLGNHFVIGMLVMWRLVHWSVGHNIKEFNFMMKPSGTFHWKVLRTFSRMVVLLWSLL